MTKKLIVSIFHDDNSAYEAAEKIKKISNDNLTVTAGILLKKDSLGNVHTLKEKDRSLWGTLGGTLFGVLIGLLAGPAGAVAGGFFGMFLGMFSDANTIDIDDAFVSNITSKFIPGTTAFILDVDEGSTRELDTIFEQNGGVVFRQEVY